MSFGTMRKNRLGGDCVEKIYISGVITGTTDYMEKFNDAEDKLISAGYSVVNPAKVNAQLPFDTTWSEYMRMSICMLEMCDSIYMLDDWKKSKGACLEHEKAVDLNKNIYYQCNIHER